MVDAAAILILSDDAAAQFLYDVDEVIDAGRDADDSNNFIHHSRLLLSPHQAYTIGVDELLSSNSGFGTIAESSTSTAPPSQFSANLTFLARSNKELKNRVDILEKISMRAEAAKVEAETQFYATDEVNSQLYYRLQALEDSNKKIVADNLGLRTENQRLFADNERLFADNQRLAAESQQLRSDFNAFQDLMRAEMDNLKKSLQERK
mmetsp:Transcript_13913/g.18935  ORF Transcript_13913/g.18935 Transcript_13913/m.18935 type:complete len:207 (+) Transcript_13913:158-778(+)